MLKAASALTDLFKEQMPGEVREALKDLKDSMTFAGKLSQQINQIRRDLIKPSIPIDYKKLASEADETSELLFGSGLCEKMEKLKKQNQLCSLLNTSSYDNKGGKRKYDYDYSSKNSHPSQKTQKRGTSYGQKRDSKPDHQKQDKKRHHKNDKKYRNKRD